MIESFEKIKEGQILLVDKDINWTSFDVIRKIKYNVQNRLKDKKIKIGHAGTLDPLATGLMILCTGKCTKDIEQFQALPKEYIATLQLGATTPSFDLETEIDNIYPTEHITVELVNSALAEFQGIIEQIPPLFSAKWVNGKRAYELARKGSRMELKPSEITIYKMELIEFELPYLTIKVQCSKGTYIRSLANDIGKKLNSGAHLISLRRTAIGDFSVNDALTIKNVEKIFDKL